MTLSDLVKALSVTRAAPEYVHLSKVEIMIALGDPLVIADRFTDEEIAAAERLIRAIPCDDYELAEDLDEVLVKLLAAKGGS